MKQVQQTQSGFADVDGARLYYEIAGEGHPLVMLHAGIAHSRMWDPQFHAFAERYRVVRYDMRGFGRTENGDQPFAHRRDLHKLLAFLEIDRAYLMGCSMGGKVAIDLSLEYPDQVDALILVSSGLNGYRFTGTPPKQWLELMAASQRGDVDLAAELVVQVWVDGPQRSPQEVDPQLRAQVRDMYIEILARKGEGAREQRLEPAAVNRLGELNVPALIVAGALDTPNILTVADLLSEGIAGANKEIVPGAAHLPNMEQAERFNRSVLAFLGAL